MKMQRLNKISLKAKVMIALILLCLAVIAVISGLHFTGDQIPPEISFDRETRTITSEEASQITKGDYSCLLKDVTAMDDVDGDVHDRTVVLHIKKSSDWEYAIVVYCAVDYHMNASTARRIVYLPGIAADRTVSVDETESDEESDEEETPIEVNPQAPVFKLTTHSVRIKVGEPFSLASIVSEIRDDKDTARYLLGKINIDGNYSLTVPGTYDVSIFVIDSDGYFSIPEKLHVIVEYAD